MFVCPSHKILFVAIPKTATRSVYMFLEKYFDGRKYREHAKVIPPQYQKYFSFCIIRNPYDRACSAWWATCKRKNIKYDFLKIMQRKGMENSLESFLIIAERQRHNLEYPQVHWVEHNRIDQILHFENLEEEFRQLYFVKDSMELPSINGTVRSKKPGTLLRPPYQELITPTTIQMINEMYQEDFEYFGFEKL